MKRRSDRRGVAALEFGLLAPLLAGLTVSALEGVMLLRGTYLLEYATRQMALTIAQQNNSPVLKPPILQDMCKGARLALRSYDNGTLSMAVVSSTYDGTPTNAPKGKHIVFEYDGACPANAPALGLTTIATDLLQNYGDNVVQVKLTMTYNSLFPAIFGNRTLSATAPGSPNVAGDTLRCELYDKGPPC